MIFKLKTGATKFEEDPKKKELKTVKKGNMDFTMKPEGPKLG